MDSLKKLLLISIFLLPAILYGQNKQNEVKDFKVKIRQQILPGPNPDYIYKLSDKRIKIYKSRSGFKYMLFSERFNKSQRDSIRLIVHNAKVNNLYHSYYSGVIDGIGWIYNFKINNRSKEIILNNYYLKELGDIVDFVNRQIPENKVCISFDIFGTRNDFTNNE
jgi:hypothetical protein